MKLSRTQRWYIYIGFFIVSIVIGSAAMNNRGGIFGYDIFRLPSTSMINTLLIGDFIISDTWKYRDSAPKRGDVVVFLSKKDFKTMYVKRVIGIPNDVVDLKDGDVYINGKKLDEPYVDGENNRGIKRIIPTADNYTVPENEYFVLGDNRDNSNDSRFYGHIPRNHIYASVEFIWFSFDPERGIRSERIGKAVD
jgi:signal peptidase I